MYSNLIEAYNENNNIIHPILENSYVNTLVNDSVSKKRFDKMKQIHEEYNLPELKINPALHWKNDFEHIQKNYPTIKRNSRKFIERPGAYGLTASFIQFLENNKNTPHQYTVWYEDDSIPADNKELFYEHLIYALDNIPKGYNNVYYLGYTTHCLLKCSNEKKWEPKVKTNKHAFGNTTAYGAHAVIFTKSSIKTILNYMKNNSITIPIDDLLYDLHKKNIINTWDWKGNIITENKMFCGLYKQLDTYCSYRNNVIGDPNKNIRTYNKNIVKINLMNNVS